MARKHTRPIKLSPRPCRPLPAAIRKALLSRRQCAPVAAGLVAVGLTLHSTVALAAVFPAELELSSLQAANGGDGNSGFILNGIDASDRFGFSVSGAGDVNGDGIEDLIVGAFAADPGGRSYAGESYVVFGLDQAGAAFPAELELSSLLAANGGDGSSGFVLNGIDAGDSVGLDAGDHSGLSVSAAGDVNGDGIDDLIVGAYGADPGGRSVAGESYVLFGRNQVGGGFPAELELSSLQAANGGDGSSGFVLNGIDAVDFSGFSVSGAGDVNGDGIDDLIVGAFPADPGGRNGAGESYVVFGRDQAGGGFPAELELSGLQAANGGDGSSGFVLNGIDTGDSSGHSVSAGGDVNGDGIDDLIVGAYRADPDGRNYAGESYVMFGRDQAVAGFSAEFELSTLLAANGGDGSLGFVLNGIDAFDRSGRKVSAAGDVNGDAIADLIIGAFGADPGGRSYAGESYVVFGRDQAGGGFPADLELSTLLAANGGNGSSGFVLNGIDANDNSGYSVDTAGDINGDGIDDVIVGAFTADPAGRNGAGESYIVFGRDQAGGGFPAELELASLLVANGGDGSSGFVLNGIDADDGSGKSVSAVADINSDGIDDLIVGADGADPGGRNGAGESYVVFGRAPDLTDSDGDGVTDDQDNCPAVSNADQADTDGDEVGDVCDNCPTAANADQANSDADNLGDACDNCTLEPNESQCDTNGDGFGNHCDADLDNNDSVNQIDLGMLRSQFGAIGANDADLDCNNVVNQVDLGRLRNAFGQPPGPSGLAP